MVIAGIAVITALVAIAVALRSSPTETPGAANIPTSQPSIAPSLTQPAAMPAPKPHVSAAAGKDLQAAQKALAEKKYDEALAALDSVMANPGKNEYDEYVMNRFYYTIYVAQHRLQEAEPLMEASLNSKFIRPDDQKRLVVMAAYLNYQLQSYDKAIEFGGRAVRLGSTNPQLTTMLAQAYYLKGDWDGAQRFVATVAAQQIAAGTTPDKSLLELWRAACTKLGDAGCEQQALEKLRTYYPAAP